MEKAIHDAYARGRFPLWVTEVSGGRPLLPNPNAGALYPVRMLLSPLPFPLAAKLFTVLHWAAAGLGALALACALGVSPAGAWIAAVTYAFSGVVVSDVFFPHVLPGVALLPWLVWAARRPGSAALRTLRLAALFALLLLAGDVFTIGMGMLAVGGWIAVGAAAGRAFLSSEAPPARSSSRSSRRCRRSLATLLWIPETNRAVSGITWREALQFAVAPMRLLELAIPYPFGAVWTNDPARIWGVAIFSRKIMGLFLTLYVGSLGVIALCVASRRRTAAARFGLFCAAASVVLSVSWRLVPAAWRDQPAPLALRNPEKFALLLAFGLAILSADALDALRARGRMPRWILWAGVGLAALAVLAAARPLAAGALAVAAAGEDASAVPGGRAGASPRARRGGAPLDADRPRARPRARPRTRAALRPRPPDGRPGRGHAPDRVDLREEEVFAPPVFARFQQKRDPRGSTARSARWPTARRAGWRRPTREGTSAIWRSCAATSTRTLRFSGAAAPCSTPTSTTATSRASRACGSSPA